MKIIVCVKQVPDTSGKVAVNPDGTLDRASMLTIINPDDKNAIEAALQLKDETGCRVTAVTMGPPPAEGMLRELIAMGCDDAVLISGREFGGSDTFATSQIIAAGLKTYGLTDEDIVICGRQAIDGDTAQVGPQIAEKLGLPQISYVADIKMEGNVPEYVEPKLEPVTEWNGKGELQDANYDPWQHNGNVDAGVGEGYDIRNTGSYIYNSFLITAGHNNYFTFGGRVFHRNGETYPEVYLVVVDESGTEHRITAIGAENDYVYFDTDATQHFTYDLSAFAGQRVEIRLVLKNNATHCVFTDIRMAGAAE